jgi:hypothetical protein
MSVRPDTRRAPAGPRHTRQKAHDPQVISEGMTLDTPSGPVDLVAVRNALAGRPTAVTPAERRYAYTIVRPDRLSIELAARGLGVGVDAVGRGFERAKARARAAERQEASSV